MEPEMRQQLRLALQSAFADYDDLSLMISEGRWVGNEYYRLSDIVDHRPMPIVLSETIDYFERFGLTEYFVRNAWNANRGNSELISFVQQWFRNLESAPGPNHPRVEPANRSNHSNDAPDLTWSRLNQIRRSVCLVESVQPEVSATGVLIAPPTELNRWRAAVLTDWRVVAPYLDEAGMPRTDSRPPLRIRFDYTSAGIGTVESVASDWCIASNRGLGYAVVGLSRKHRLWGLWAAAPLNREPVKAYDTSLPIGSPVYVFHHAARQPIALSCGNVRDGELAGGLISYSARMLPNSAGAPCFDSSLRLVAIHLSKTPDGNRGLRIDAVRDQLAQDNCASLLDVG